MNCDDLLALEEIEQFKIAYIGINYNIPGHYPFRYGFEYKNFNIRKIEDIDIITLDFDMYIVIDNKNNKLLDERVINKIKGDKPILSNIKNEKVIYFEIPNDEDNYINMKSFLMHLIHPIVLSDLAAFDMHDIAYIMKNKKRVNLHINPSAEDYKSFNKNSTLFIVFSEGVFCDLTLEVIADKVDIIRNNIFCEDRMYFIARHIDETEDNNIFIYEFIPK